MAVQIASAEKFCALPNNDLLEAAEFKMDYMSKDGEKEELTWKMHKEDDVSNLGEVENLDVVH